ncbi:hypothetical protein A2U01_0062127 [Trifolium medium]|uniref:Uncharacterized protein n=1 Tax=Trifolium medium TaxID=97028 RepID=A0A392RXT5_9FABA|nr:hypothetical protein [Trifolium medium]
MIPFFFKFCSHVSQPLLLHRGIMIVAAVFFYPMGDDGRSWGGNAKSVCTASEVTDAIDSSLPP